MALKSLRRPYSITLEDYLQFLKLNTVELTSWQWLTFIPWFLRYDSLLSKLTKKKILLCSKNTRHLFNLLLKRKTEHIISLEKIYGFCSILMEKKFLTEFFPNILNIFFTQMFCTFQETITINNSNFIRLIIRHRSLYFLILKVIS